MKIAIISYLILTYGIGVYLLISERKFVTWKNILLCLLCPLMIPAAFFVVLYEAITKKELRWARRSKPRKLSELESGNRNDENFTHKEDADNSIVTDESYNFSMIFRKALRSGDFSEFENVLDDDVVLTLYRHKTIKSSSAVLEYWKDWIVRYADKLTQGDQIIRFCGKYAGFGVNLINRGSSGYIYFRTTNGKIADMVYMSQWATDGFVGSICETHNVPFSVDFISRYLGESIECPENSLPCLECGTRPEELIWNRFSYESGIHTYGGQVSVCPHCNRVVDLYTNIKLRNETPIEEKDEYKPALACGRKFPAGLYGTFTLSSDDVLKGTRYVDKLPDDVLAKQSNWQIQEIMNSPYESASIRSCAEECNWLLINSLRRENSPYYDSIKKCYEQAMNDGVYEAANNLAIMYVNEEDNLKAEQLFTKAIHDGHSKNAMLNLAMCYWGVECDYQKAVELLKYVSTLEEPSIHCLWNLAYLQYMGDECQNNPIKRDLNECANTLKKIIVLADNPNYAEDKGVINNAIAALYLTEQNDFTEVAREFQDLISVQNYSHNSEKVLKILDSLSIPDGYQLLCHGNKMREHSVGDNSFLYVSKRNSEDTDRIFDEISHIWERVHVEDNEMGAWQVYLLMNTIHVMEYFWHGGYHRNSYIYTLNDAYSLPEFINRKSPLNNLDLKLLYDRGLIQPSIKYYREDDVNSSATIDCTYWNNWGGLIRERISIKMRGNQVVSYERIGQTPLFKYDCGILF